MERFKFVITVNDNVTIYIGFWSNGKELIQINDKDDSHCYSIADLMQRMEIKRSREVFIYIR